MKSAYLWACVVACMFAGWALAQEATSFREWKSPAGRFRVDIPSSAPVKSAEQKMSGGSIYYYWTVPLSKDDGIIFGYFDLSTEDRGDNAAQQILQSFRRGSRQGQAHTLLQDLEITLGKVPGRDSTIALQDGDDGFIRERNYLDGLRLYRLIVVGSTKEALTSESAERFLSSFKISDAAATPSVQKLAGFFSIVTCERDGKRVEVPSGKTCFFSSGRGSIYAKVEDSRPRIGNILLDDAASPRQLDLISTNGADDWVQRAIFQLDGKDLKLCIADEGVDRPTEFETSPGSGTTLYLLRSR